MAIKERSCWLWLEDMLYCFCMECTVVILTLINMLIITTELLINLRIITAPSPSSQHNEDLENTSINFSEEVNLSVPTRDRTSPVLPQHIELSAEMKTAEFVCHYLSISIVALFLLEIFLKMLVKNRDFFQEKWQIFDSVVVIVAFTVELILTLSQPDSVYWELVTFVVALRLWRFIFICNKKSDSWKREREIEILQYDESKRKEEDYYRDLQIKLDKQEKEIKRLESMLRRYQQDNNIDTNRNNTLLEILESKELYERYAEDQSTAIIATATEEVSHLHHGPSEGIGNGHVPCRYIERQNSQEDQSEHEVPYDNNNRHLYRAGSESSVSQDGGLTTIHNVHVDVEEGLPPQDTDTVTGDTRSTGSVTEIEDVNFVYTNQSFETDISLDERNWPVLSEIDGTKTYCSADGIPMTSL